MSRFRIVKNANGERDVQQIPSGERSLTREERHRLNEAALTEAAKNHKRIPREELPPEGDEPEVPAAPPAAPPSPAPLDPDAMIAALAASMGATPEQLKAAIAAQLASTATPAAPEEPPVLAPEPEVPAAEAQTAETAETAPPADPPAAEPEKKGSAPKGKAKHPCPHCDFVASGQGGLTSHVKAQHPDGAKG